MARRRKTKFENPLEAGRYFLQLKAEGLTADKIGDVCLKSIPAVYKYISLAESPREIQDHIDAGNIPATKVIRLMDSAPKGTNIVELVNQAIEQREENQRIMTEQGVTKMTVKRRLQVFQEEAKDITSENAQLLMKFAERLNAGASVKELMTFTRS